jgi:ubiquinone/menaquinone biosynthesis C-methylase UbiE
MTEPHIYEGHDLEVLADLPNYYGWIIEVFRPYIKGRTMEIGTGIGTVSKLIIEDTEELILVAPSAHLTEYLPTSISKSPKVFIFNETLEQRLPRMADHSCETVIMVNVLEHIEDDGSALEGLHRVLKPGGHLLLFVPALQPLYSELDRKHGHFRRYHLAPLAYKLNTYEFIIHDKRYFDLAGVLPWWLINTLAKKTEFNPAIATLYDRFFVPITKFIERYILPPLGKNILIIAERAALKPE